MFSSVSCNALPRSDATADDTVFVAPRTPLEQAVHAAWQETLHISEPVSVYANFFQMGGNSLQAGALCSRLRAVLGSEAAIPIVWVLECQTIEALAARLADAGAVASLSALPPLTATVTADAYGIKEAPLSFQQVGMPLQGELRGHVRAVHICNDCLRVCRNDAICVCCRNNSSSCGSWRQHPAHTTLGFQPSYQATWTPQPCNWQLAWCSSARRCISKLLTCKVLRVPSTAWQA